MWKKTDDGSFVDGNGKVIFFSAERFEKDICLGNCCFICGAAPGSKEFNNEHILPEWLLRKYDLFDKEVTLPNGNSVRYASYTVPCCKECNDLMGREVEALISKVVNAGRKAMVDFVQHGGALQLFVWMGLIYLKTHLKDRNLRFHLDRRKGEGKIADVYNWRMMHHLHSLVRCFYNDCEVEPEAIGSLFILPANQQGGAGEFDYSDYYEAQTMMIRLGDLAVIAVFDDSGASMSHFYPNAEKIVGPVSRVQLREIQVELGWLNLHLKDRTRFHTECDMQGERCRIVGTRGSLDLHELDLEMRGKMLHHALFGQGQIDHLGLSIPAYSSAEEAEAAVKSGKVTFLFDDEGKFIRNSIMPLSGIDTA